MLTKFLIKKEDFIKIIDHVKNYFLSFVFFLKDCMDMNFQKINLIFSVLSYTMLTYPRLSKIYEIVNLLETEGIDGNLVECGVCNGGSAGIIASVVKKNKNRHVWLFDSWEGLPEAGKDDISYTEQRGHKGDALGSEEKVKELLFKKLKLNNNIHLVKGWFSNSILAHKGDIGDIALLHLDCDWYESVMFCLKELYDNIVKDGFIIIDDYGFWKGCKKAVDEFIELKGLKIKLIKIDYTSVYFQKQ
jgi:hypothetical protein